MEKLGVLLVNDMALFPNSEIRIEYERDVDKQILAMAEANKDQEILIINPILDDFQNITSFPNIGVVGKIKLKIDVPNGKTRLVLSGIKRVDVIRYIENNGSYEAEVEDINIIISEQDNIYREILVKSLENYINSVPYISNSILSQIPTINTLDELCDMIGTFLPFQYDKKKKYVLEINPISRCKLLLEDINEDLKVK